MIQAAMLLMLFLDNYCVHLELKDCCESFLLSQDGAEYGRVGVELHSCLTYSSVRSKTCKRELLPGRGGSGLCDGVNHR